MTSHPLRLALAAAAAATLAGCVTPLPPTQVVRYHLDQQVPRGTIAVQPGTPNPDTMLSFTPFSAAVQAQLRQIGYPPAAPGAQADFIAITDVRQHDELGPPRRSPVSIGLGAGGYSGGGGWRGGSGVGLGGGVGFPVGGGGARAVLVTELSVIIKRRADQTAVWEGHARSIVDARGAVATTDVVAGKLAAALFAGFPGQSGRTVEVK